MNGVTEGDFVFSDATKRYLVAYSGMGGNVTVPATVNTIGGKAFYGCSGLTSVTIPNSITSIGQDAFRNCSNLSSITMLSSTAPQLGSQAFSRIDSSAVFYVPCRSYSSYSDCGYGSYGTIVDPIHDLSITVSSNDSFLGTASVVLQDGCRIACDSTTIIKAEGKTVNGVAATQFVRWSDGNTENPRTLHLTGSTTLTAIFAPVMQCTISVSSSDASMGTATGGGIYNYGDNVTLTATPTAHHHLVRWNSSGGESSTSNPYTFRATEDRTYTATFAEDSKYRISGYSEDLSMGTVEGTGTYYEGEYATLTAVPAEHHHFTQWDDGSTENPRRIRVTQNKTYFASFAVNVYTVTVSSNDITRGTAVGGGRFTYPTAITVSATAYSGYQFVRWSNGVGHNPYTFAVTTDMDLVAIFIPEGTIYNITAVPENPSMGSVVGGGPYGVGERAELTAIPEYGYRFDHWSDGSRQNPRTVVVSADATYVAYFVSEVGIGDVDMPSELRIWAAGGSIHVVGAEGMAVRVYDVLGRLVVSTYSSVRQAAATSSSLEEELRVPVAGVYLVKVGALPARKVVVM